MHIYAFGSLCRGEISLDSDVDLLAIVQDYEPRIDPDKFSIYSYKRIQEIWREGNPFAWHLSIESRLIFSSNNLDYIKGLGNPNEYKNCVRDCEKFFFLFKEAWISLSTEENSRIFDLSIVFLSIRNIATCFSFASSGKPNFSRNAALNLGSNSIPIKLSVYKILEKSRILCTRGYGKNITNNEINIAIGQLAEVDTWMKKILDKAKEYERV